MDLGLLSCQHQASQGLASPLLDLCLRLSAFKHRKIQQGRLADECGVAERKVAVRVPDNLVQVHS